MTSEQLRDIVKDKCFGSITLISNHHCDEYVIRIPKYDMPNFLNRICDVHDIDIWYDAFKFGYNFHKNQKEILQLLQEDDTLDMSRNSEHGM